MVESDCARFDEEEFVADYLKERVDVIDVTWDDSALRDVERVHQEADRDE